MQHVHRFLMQSIVKMSLFVHYEWHLTQGGWILGDWSANDELIEPKTPPPADRVETWVTTEISYDGWVTKAQTEWALIWASPQQSETDREILRSRHHKPRA